MTDTITITDIADNELLSQASLKTLCRRMKLKLTNGRYSKLKITKNLYIYFSITKTNEINYKFVFRVVTEGRQKDITLKARTVNTALDEMKTQKSMNKGEFVTISQLWNIYINSEKFKTLSVKSKQNYSLFYKAYFDTAYVKNVLNINVMELFDYSKLFTFLNKVLNQKTKSHHNISTAVYIIARLFDVLAVKFNLLLNNINLINLKKDLSRDLPKKTVKHVNALIGINGTIEELENNIIEFYKALDLTKCDLLTKLTIDFKMYSALRGSEVLQLTKRNIKDNQIIVDKLKTLDYFSLPLTETMQHIIKRARSINTKSRYIFNKAEEYKITNSTQLTHAFKYVSNNINTENLQTKNVLSLSAHGTRTMIREFFYLNEDKILYSVAESCLTHKLGNQVTQSYLRNQFALTEGRAKAMQLWSDFLDTCKVKADSKLTTENVTMAKLEIV